MESKRDQGCRTDGVKGLPKYASADPQALAAEKSRLAEVANQGTLSRWKYYWSMSGPGWMQSALTLGAGSASASLFAGAFMGYRMLWIQPLAMILGVIMLGAMSYQTLITGERPFEAMRRYIHPAMAWAWALASLASTIIWHLPQYALASGMTEDIVKAVSGWNPQGAHRTALLVGIGVSYMLLSIYITWSYGKGRRGVRIYEKVLKWFVWIIILTFLVVVMNQTIRGQLRWGEVLRGLIPSRPKSEVEMSMMLAAFASAIGINMTFLFPYTLLTRGWSREHWPLSKFDLVTGMLLPYSVATGLVIIVAGATLHGKPEIQQLIAAGKTTLSPTQAASMFEQAGLNLFVARIVFGAGILGMVLSSITMQMLVAGFAVCEMFGYEPGGRAYKLACLIPTPAIVGVIMWAKWGPWVAVPTSAICGVMLPIAYVAFFLLNNSVRFLGAYKPRGIKATLWNIGMMIAIVASTAGAINYLIQLAGFFHKLMSK